GADVERARAATPFAPSGGLHRPGHGPRARREGRPLALLERGAQLGAGHGGGVPGGGCPAGDRRRPELAGRRHISGRGRGHRRPQGLLGRRAELGRGLLEPDRGLDDGRGTGGPAMERGWLVIVLLLSPGLHVGILAAVAARRLGPGGAGAKAPGAANQPPDPLPRLPQLANRLGLEGEERRRFLDVQWNLYQETSHLRLQLGEVHRDLRRELIRPEPDKAQVDRLLAESARIYLTLERALVNNVLATRERLGPDREKEYL